MPDRIARFILAFGLWSGALPTAAGAMQEAALDSLISAQMAELKIPGLAAAAVDSGRVIWVGTYGWANIEEREAVTEHTPFMIASVGIIASIVGTPHPTRRAAERTVGNSDGGASTSRMNRSPALHRAPQGGSRRAFCRTTIPAYPRVTAGPSAAMAYPGATPGPA